MHPLSSIAGILMLTTALACAAESPPEMAAEKAEMAEMDVVSETQIDLELRQSRTDSSVEMPELGELETASDARWILFLDDLDFPAGAYYEVYVDLPTTVEPDADGRHFAGNLAPFGPRDEKASVGFEITELLRAHPATDESLSLTFVRRGLVPPAGQPELEAGDETPVVGSVRIVRQNS